MLKYIGKAIPAASMAMISAIPIPACFHPLIPVFLKNSPNATATAIYSMEMEAAEAFG